MKNSGWLVMVGMFVLTLAACGSGDATEGGNDGATDPSESGDAGTVGPDSGATGPTGASCGNGTCEAGEGCSSCENDCGCTTEYTTCREDACVDWDTINLLLKKLPGHWVAVEPPNSDAEADVTVDPSDPDCHDGLVAGGYDPNPNPNEPGDACIGGFRGAIYLVLHGSSLRIVFPDTIDSAEGQVLNEGARVEFTETYGSDELHYIYERQ